MKKARILRILLFFLFVNSLFAQEILHHKPGHKYDFRPLLLEVPEHHFDIIHYQFDWNLDFESRSIEGKAVIQAKSLADDLNNIILHLSDTMLITRITQNDRPLNYVHQDDTLDIYLDTTYPSGQEFEVEITYQGYPQSGLNFSYHQNQPIIWSLDEPSLARNWFPCYDLPSDKATAEMRISVPAPFIVASNGTLTDVTSNFDNTLTYVWKEDYPIATYLISIAASNYVTFSDYYASDQRNMEVRYFAYPEHLHQAQEDFSITVPMIEFYSQAFGEYPFLREKYGMAEIPGSASMEHQTCTSYSSRLVNGTHQYDWIIAHELAHQWWGDLVTLSDWSDIWLNEGFATYSDALWQENIYGFEGLKARMAAFKNIYFTYHQGSEHPIHDPPPDHLFCEIEYEKAAWVLHMLRHVVGDDNFWKILRKYAQDYAYATASTEDFKSVCEQIYGLDLDWFFHQWIYEAGYPSYQFAWSQPGRNRIRVHISQVQQDFPLFKMPIELQFTFPSGEEKKIVWVGEKRNTFDFTSQEEPLDVLFDPDGWILCEVIEYKKGMGRR